MRAVRYHEFGGPDVLAVEELERPAVGDEEVLVGVRAAGVNHLDKIYREGGKQSSLPRVPGLDFAGVIEETGAEVTSFEVGDRVFGVGAGMHGHQGAYAEYLAIPTDRIARLPDGVGYEEGASGHVGVTAWFSLFDRGRLAPGETCLVHGGSGGVGHLAVQLASAAGADAIATVGSAEAETFVDELGAHVALDYRDEELAAHIANAAPLAPAVILDPRPDEHLAADIEVAGPAGRIVLVGGDGGELSPASLARRKGLTFYTPGAISDASDLGAVLRRLARLMETGRLRPQVAGTYPLEEAARAQRELRDSHLGTLVVTV